MCIEILNVVGVELILTLVICVNDSTFYHIAVNLLVYFNKPTCWNYVNPNGSLRFIFVLCFFISWAESESKARREWERATRMAKFRDVRRPPLPQTKRHEDNSPNPTAKKTKRNRLIQLLQLFVFQSKSSSLKLNGLRFVYCTISTFLGLNRSEWYVNFQTQFYILVFMCVNLMIWQMLLV